jgi:hypothetical protein
MQYEVDVIRTLLVIYQLFETKFLALNLRRRTRMYSLFIQPTDLS